MTRARRSLFPLPFRWDLRQRSTFDALLVGEVAPSYDGFTDDLLTCCARILALSGGADLCFVGRSLDSVFDHLGGLLLGTSWESHIELLPLSLLRQPASAFRTAARRRAFQDYLETQRLDPVSLAHRTRPVALVDLVSTGRTLGGVVEALHDWCQATGGDWGSAARKLRIVAMTCRQKTSPHTERWSQQVGWLKLLERGAAKSVSVPSQLYRYLGDTQPKLAPSFGPSRWGDPSVESPRHQAEHLQALRLSVQLFDLGRDLRRREAFARELARQPTMEQPWLRSLVVEIRRGRSARVR